MVGKGLSGNNERGSTLKETLFLTPFVNFPLLKGMYTRSEEITSRCTVVFRVFRGHYVPERVLYTHFLPSTTWSLSTPGHIQDSDTLEVSVRLSSKENAKKRRYLVLPSFCTTVVRTCWTNLSHTSRVVIVFHGNVFETSVICARGRPTPLYIPSCTVNCSWTLLPTLVRSSPHLAPT